MKYIIIISNSSFRLFVTLFVRLFILFQVHAGAQMLQVFDSHAGELTPEAFAEFGLPYLQQICKRVRVGMTIQVNYVELCSWLFFDCYACLLQLFCVILCVRICCCAAFIHVIVVMLVVFYYICCCCLWF